jgi:hypothetical protein
MVPVNPEMVAVMPPATDTGSGELLVTTVAVPVAPYASFIIWKWAVIPPKRATSVATAAVKPEVSITMFVSLSTAMVSSK